MRTRAPGKVILSGEHAVIYNQTALALAINQYATWTLKKTKQPGITLSLMNCKTSQSYTYDQCQEVYDLLNKRQTVSPKMPALLYIYSIMCFLKHYPEVTHETALHLSLQSQIPIGAGMGSSAATLSALHLALYRHFKINDTKNELIHMTAVCEKIQHGCLSRIDPYIVTLGGAIEILDQTVNPLPFKPNQQWHLIYTGQPESATQDCVRYVKQHIHTQTLWNTFQSITIALKSAILQQKHCDIFNAIQNNQTLLHHIGVVPDTIQCFIEALSQDMNVSAKITGAGSIKGEKAGMLLAYSPHAISFEKLAIYCSSYHYTCYPLTLDLYGAQIC
ncbi:MAG: mevalonate kinase [Endozoicomonadaceae bacterium]|nr:mevalonate kinase [Endozoicomonadaceae bacterium]